MIKILQGNCIEQLKNIDDESIQTVVTSPPYWGLRDYGVDNQLGLESTPQEYVKALVGIFKEVKRVLRPDGTVWLNLGDTYVGTGKDDTGDPKALEHRNTKKDPVNNKVPGLASKNLVGIPWRVAFALQNDGWFLRQDIIWAKSNAMPEPVKDRCTKSHEHIFLLSKNARYYYDNEAIKEDSMDIGETNQRFGGNKYGNDKSGDYLIYSGKKYTDSGKRNKRDVWNIATNGYSEAHFATFPVALPELCIKAGSKEKDLVLDPFAGAGTTGLVADRLGRDAVLIELNPKYVKMIEDRIRNDAPMFVDIQTFQT